ncbi:MAG: hypothetical protein ACOYJ2_08685 [Rickettsiales bacterium]
MLSFYIRKRSYFKAAAFLLPLLLPMLKFLWDIEARSLWIDSLPDQTYSACFNVDNIGYTLIGFFYYPFKMYLPLLIVFLLLLLPFEIAVAVKKGKQ